MDKYGTLEAFVEEMERTGGADKLAILIERSSPAPIDEPILQSLRRRMFPQLATPDSDGNNAFRRACFDNGLPPPSFARLIAPKPLLTAESKNRHATDAFAAPHSTTR